MGVKLGFLPVCEKPPRSFNLTDKKMGQNKASILILPGLGTSIKVQTESTAVIEGWEHEHGAG